MPVPLVVAGIIGGAAVIKGVNGYMKRKRLNKEQKAQANQLKSNTEAIMQQAQRGEKDIKDAMEEINTMVRSVGGTLQKIAQREIDLSVDQQLKTQDLQLRRLDSNFTRARRDANEQQSDFLEQAQKEVRNFRKSIKDTRKQIRRANVQQRFAGSEKAVAEQRKLAEVEGAKMTDMMDSLTKQQTRFTTRMVDLEDQFNLSSTEVGERTRMGVERARTEGLGRTQREISNLMLQGEQMKQGLGAELRRSKQSSFEQGLQLGSAEDKLRQSSKRSPWSGALAGVSDIAGQAAGAGISSLLGGAK